jgi:hypothetical protein
MRSTELAHVDACLRCHAPTPHPASDEFLDWDPIGDDDLMICPGCLTEAEEEGH